METAWESIVIRNRTALLGVLAAIVAMANLATGQNTLPRHLYRAVLALMRPLESAIRRLMIVAARDITVPPYPPKPAPPPKPSVVPAWSNRTGIVEVPIKSWGIAAWNQPPKPKHEPKPATHYLIPICDPIWPLGRKRRKRVPPHLGPRISLFDDRDPPRPKAPPKPTRDDPMDAARIRLRLDAYARALNDLPKAAKRVARWLARQKAGYIRRLSPLRSGRVYGLRGKRSRRPEHVIDDILLRVHRNADWSLDPRSRSDTS